MAQGTVKWFSEEKGFGFISPDEGSEDLFVHYSGIVGNGFRSLDEGSKVTYEATQGKKGMQAENVSLAARSPCLHHRRLDAASGTHAGHGASDDQHQSDHEPGHDQAALGFEAAAASEVTATARNAMPWRL